jgi:hypothetical protein
MKQFKLGVAALLSSMTVIGVIAANVDRLNAMGEGLDGLMGIALAAISIIIALPAWLCAITMWHKLHNRSYRAFKNWCIGTIHTLY